MGDIASKVLVISQKSFGSNQFALFKVPQK